MKLFKQSLFIISITFLFSLASNAQQQNDFWKNVHFGGGLGLNVGTGFTDVTVAPSAIYQFNPYISAGIGLQGSYISVKPKNSVFENYEAFTYGGSLIALVDPIREIQLSAELEQIRVNVDFDNGFSDNFWNTALFLGAGYRTQNITVGIRYNVLHDNKKSIYKEAFMPFVRIYF